MAIIYAGTSGWAYTSWRPKFYPAKLGSANFLNYYATRLNTVEVNYTFRNVATKKLLMEWVAATPPDFIFAVKAHQKITHIKRLRGATKLTARFISSLQPLAGSGKLGPVLFQLPPNFKCDLKLLQDFLAGLPHQTRVAFEFRHASWFADEVYGLLRQANAALCLAESEKLVTPNVQTADFSYFRLRKDGYSSRARKAVARRAAELAGRGDVFVYFKHEKAPTSALHAKKLLTESRNLFASSEGPLATIDHMPGPTSF
jgi:uncharacterized protein YecE (DUF72 family)